MLNFLEGSHKFDVMPNAVRQNLEFGQRQFFTTLTPGLDIPALETSLSAGGPLFNNAQVIHAVVFAAESIVVTPKEGNQRFPEIDLRNKFDFGFVQGLKASDLHLDFWGRFKTHGRTITHISMPNIFEVDTHPLSQPFTRVAAGRFEIKNVTQAGSQFNFLKVIAEGADHPMYSFSHTIDHPIFGPSVKNFLRQVTFKTELRTIFCFREKKTGNFSPISSTVWTIHFNHVVRYTNNGQVRVVTDQSPGAFIPRKGLPSNINATDRSILAMAKAGTPFLTPAVLQGRFASGSPNRTVTALNENDEFDPNFFT